MTNLELAARIDEAKRALRTMAMDTGCTGCCGRYKCCVCRQERRIAKLEKQLNRKKGLDDDVLSAVEAGAGDWEWK